MNLPSSQGERQQDRINTRLTHHGEGSAVTGSGGREGKVAAAEGGKGSSSYRGQGPLFL